MQWKDLGNDHDGSLLLKPSPNLELLVNQLQKFDENKFDIKVISETRITSQGYLLNNLNVNNHSFEFTPTETSTGGSLLCIANHLSYKCCNDLNIYKKNELESTFIEIVNLKKIKYFCVSHLQKSSYGLMTLTEIT